MQTVMTTVGPAVYRVHTSITKAFTLLINDILGKNDSTEAAASNMEPAGAGGHDIEKEERFRRHVANTGNEKGNVFRRRMQLLMVAE